MRAMFAAVLFLAIPGFSAHVAVGMPDGEMQVVTATSTVRQEPAPPIEIGHYLDIDGSKVYYEECGSGSSIVLLHDGLLHSITWDGVWAPLCQKFHVVRYDRRGYGRSDPAKASYSPAEDLHVLLQHLNVGRAVVVGNSSGASLAIDFALAHPD
jgi:hypothetical protein